MALVSESSHGTRPTVCLSVLKSGLHFRYNVCILAYGQTGSGKSFTTLGPRSREEPAPLSESFGDSDIIPRAAGGLFRYRAGSEDEQRYNRHGAEGDSVWETTSHLQQDTFRTAKRSLLGVITTNARNAYDTFMSKFYQ